MLILVSTVTGCISISAFASLVCFYWYCMFCRRIKHLCIIAGIKKYKSVINKKKKKNDKIVLLGKDELNTIKILISKTLIDLYISHDKFVSVNNVF